MAIAPLLSNFAQNTRPRVTSVKRQPTTKRAPGFRGLLQPATITARKPAAPKPAAAAPAVPRPVAPTAPAPIPIPPDATYEQAVAIAARNRDTTIAGLGQQRTAGLQEYGYTEGPGGLQFDPSNPFSRAAELKRQYEIAQRGNVTGMASRGQLYSGALQNAQDYSTRGFNAGEDSLSRALIAFLASNTRDTENARLGYEQDVSQAEAGRLSRAADSPLYDPVALAAAGAPPPVQRVAAAPRTVVKPSAAHGGRKYVYRVNSNGSLTPLHPA